MQSENGPFNTEAKALNEAVEYVMDFGWHYIETLSNHSYPVNFNEQILDAEYDRRNPDAEFSRKQSEMLWKEQLEKATKNKPRFVQTSTGAAMEIL